MFKPFAELALAFFNILAISIAGVSILFKRREYEETLETEKKKPGKIFFARVRAFKSVYTFAVYAIIIALILSIFIIGFGVNWSVVFPKIEVSATPSATPSRTPMPTTKATSIPTNSPTKPGSKETALDDYGILNKSPDTAFFFHSWDDLFPIKVKNVEYEHSIGVRVPENIIEDFKNNNYTDRKQWNATIEYSLDCQFDSFQFDYGVDDNSFVDEGLTPPQCYYWIVVESCSSDKSCTNTPIELYRTKVVNYMKRKGESPYIDVSNVETLRLTIYWLFDVMRSKPVALNVAILNPILYSTDNE